MTDTTITKKSKRSIWIPLLVLVTLAACATAGYSYWRFENKTAEAAPKEAPPPAAPVFFPLDTFTVNLGDADRVLYVGVTLRMKGEADRARLNDYLPEVRSRMLLLLSRQDATKLATDEGKKQLAADIKATLSAPLIAGQPKQDITDVLYTAFILR
ncbi:TPA: flagellar basal body-associated protein FliL [Kluyvera cryocrescens]|uniref:Flagellar protein FliL n=2 Tax=Kluyvera cryocrescens TaxID=580 RepID=A0A2X3G9F0_KLUCR|nr:flagellar basal body-associated protein FliL [Kluyvera cryocrescens]MCX2869490.1 flagellar basal body-associated protein FliL [Kluyvera cryocrescens]MDU5686960.1 flagellar basal body-associated protein FliL [Kluyvera cryocrescens]MDW3776739.1 flagellar basal body-associated protein FliL [Kluyvera cryocrescens]MEB6633050.1 flagellar basal body-associated protein FliL [Kluyvera cryocrescens]MEB7559400.1 flagellar basal body-associated protein FliL [Kluyvera cryocrescens]